MNHQSEKKWNISLWVLQILLAVLFGMGGLTKLTTPIDELSAQMSWVPLYSEEMVRFIGAAEVAGALGLILPSALRILPVLSPIAALGLATVMVLAARVHYTLGELPLISVNAVLASLALLIAWGRLKKAKISPRA